MTSRAQTDGKQRCIGPDGREYVAVTVSKNRAFAAACLAEMAALDGKDRRWMMQHKAVNVPADVLPYARARLEREA